MDDIPDNDHAWKRAMLAAQSGDKQAYHGLLAELLPFIERSLMKKMGAHANIEDVVQETLLAIHKARHTYDARRPFMPWLAAIMHYKYVDYIRRKKRRENKEVLDDAAIETFSVTSSGEQANTGLSEELEGALNTLPPKQREAVQLLKLEGLSVKEAAVRTGYSESAIKTSAHRGYQALKQYIRKHGGQNS